MARTDWTSIDTVRPADMNQIGQEINDLQNAVSNINIPDASLTDKGIVQLSNATDGIRENVAPTEKALKAAYERGSEGVAAAAAAQAKANAAETPGGAQAKATEALGEAKQYTDQKVGAITKTSLGLGNVANYVVATQAEAEAGTAADKYMTPLRVKQAIDKLSAARPGTGQYSVVEGQSTATGDFSHAEGYLTTASNYYAHAEGYLSTASGFYAHAEGYNTKALEQASHAEGYQTTASGVSAHAEGYLSTASGSYSHAEGYQTEANVRASHVMGQFNNPLYGHQSAFNRAGDAFVIGNGASLDAKGNAFRVSFEGRVYGLSAYNSSGADYAEMFEWVDGNPGNEDRVGYFVTMEGEKIRKASFGEYVLGIVSANPSVIGDNHDDWYDKYIRDEFGRIRHHFISVPAVMEQRVVTDEDGNETLETIEITPEHREWHPMLNPEWNNDEPYVERFIRPEWDAVGMIGKLFVWDDGTCQVNGFCAPADGGIATAAEIGYRVIKRAAPNIIQIIMK